MYRLKFIIITIGIINVLHAQPVKLHPDNPHYFLYKEKPRIFITSAEHYGAVLNLDFDYQTYLQTLHDNGMDYTRIFTGVYVENTESFGIDKNTLAPLKNRLITPWARSKEPGYVNGGNKFDLDQWNPTYFKRLHDFVSMAEKLDIIVEVTFFSSIYNESNWGFCPFYHENNVNPTDRIDRIFVHTKRNGNLLKHQKSMVQKITKELNEYDNVVYEIQNEPWSDQEGQVDLFNKTVMPKEGQKWYSKSNQASELSLEWQSAMSMLVNDTESKLAKKHLIAQNYCNYRQAISAVDPTIDIMNFHYAWPEAVDLNYGFDRPISFDESGFSPKDEAIYRKQAWRFILAGGAVFNNLDYSFVVGHEDGSFEENTSPGLGSREFRKQLTFLKKFMNEIDYVKMKPSRHLIKHVPGFIYQGLAEAGKTYVYYFEGNGFCNVQLYTKSGSYKVAWTHPETGKIVKTENIKAKNDVLLIHGPEVIDDIALKVIKE